MIPFCAFRVLMVACTRVVWLEHIGSYVVIQEFLAVKAVPLLNLALSVMIMLILAPRQHAAGSLGFPPVRAPCRKIQHRRVLAVESFPETTSLEPCVILSSSSTFGGLN